VVIKAVLSGSKIRPDGRTAGRRAPGPLAVALTAALLVLSGCSGGGGEDGGPGGGREEKAKPTGPSDAVVTISPEDGADGVRTTDALGVTVEKGKLTRVSVRTADGEKVPGSITRDGSEWKPDRHLRTETSYRVKAIAEDAEGRTAAEAASFSTMVPANTFIGHYTPEDGSTVGVGMPVSLSFNRPVTEREAVEKAVSVTADPAVEIEGHWFGDSRLDFRPEDYWEPGTKVTLDLGLDGVEGADGVYGTQDKKVRFTVGRSQVSVVDVKKKTMTVTRDGEKLKTVPITAGAPENPTYNGKMVITERHKVTRMNGETVGFGDEYDIKDVPHAMRLSTSGTFIHGNYWAGRAAFGSVNGSHGCVGLFDVRGGYDKDTPAAWFYDNSLIGDVVEVRNSRDETIEPDNGLNAWNMDWAEWKAAQ
jgi:lipoprotein-anchoring transpeptidase ErfK/SrfK